MTRLSNRQPWSALRTSLEFGKPADVANLCAYLCSVQAGYITGQDIHVMGGLDLFTY